MTTHAPLTIRRATPADAAAYTRIMGHPEVLPNLMLEIGPEPGSPDFQD